MPRKFHFRGLVFPQNVANSFKKHPVENLNVDLERLCIKQTNILTLLFGIFFIIPSYHQYLHIAISWRHLH